MKISYSECCLGKRQKQVKLYDAHCTGETKGTVAYKNLKQNQVNDTHADNPTEQV